ncbi:hypothetical protein Tco_1434507, partial [Tanacetum coccineum]
LSGKTSSNDRLRPSRVEILWGMYHKEKFDYVALIQEDLQYQIDNRIGEVEVHQQRSSSEDDGVFGIDKPIPNIFVTDDIQNSEAYKTSEEVLQSSRQST